MAPADAREDRGSAAGFVQQPDMSRPAASSNQANGAAADTATRTEPLMPESQADDFHRRWEEIQTGFVDEPRRAVERADQLVAEVIKRIAEVFADERGQLEAQWSKGDQVDTEALRLALRRYRSFFERLLAA
jgi:hypothetical protein